MPVYETYSKRMRKAERAGQPDVYQYVELPKPFRVQVIHILSGSIGADTDEIDYSENPQWVYIHNTLAREFGVLELGKGSGYAADKCKEHILTGSTENTLDIIEISFRTIDDMRGLPKQFYSDYSICQKPDDAIAELNQRFREHGIGYQFENGEIIRVDSQYLHAEAVKPAISLLNEAGFEGALDEFMQAHEHYRHGDHKDAINNALKAFESTMKVICAQRGWMPPANPQARHLIETIITNGLISPEMLAFFNGLRPVLESGLPTLRNRTSGHGQGETPVTVPGYLAAYALHMTAANLVMLVEAHKAMP